MPFIKLQFKQGINRDQTNYTGEGGWWDCDKIRFFSGYPQKIGGWLRYTSETFIGTCRQMFNWITSFTDNLLALGTNQKVYIEVGGIFYDITPIATTSAAGETQFLAVNGSSTIIVADDGFGGIAGTYVTFAGAVSLGGNITAAVLNQEYKIESVITTVNTDLYTITAKNPSTGAPVLASSSDVTSDTFTADASTDTITFATYTPTNGDRFYLYNSGGALPAGLNANTVYYAIGSASTSCQLSLTSGGSAVNITGAGTGTQTASLFGGGASTTAEYQINPGFASITAGYGWGTGAWNGSYGWGLASSTPVYLPQRDWFFDNFDNDLVMNIRAVTTGSDVAVGGPIYYWERGGTVNPATALATRAVLLSSIMGATDVPESATQILVSQNDKHLLAFGCQPYGGSSGDFDPLLIRWASQDDPLMWEPLPTNSAGFIRVSRGSRIVRAIPNRQETLILTDASVYSLQFTGTTDVFALQELSDNISIISPRAVTTTNNITYWMGIDKFYMYDGRVKPLPTTVREYVFKDLNFAQADQIVSGTNEGYNEVWWFYPSGTSTWVDRYVIFNYLDQCWYFGTIDRTAWLDTSLRPYPYAAYTPPPADPVNDPYNQDPGVIYQHEFGINDDTAPMVSYIQSNDFDIQQNDGETFMLTRRLIPDINFNGSTAQQPEVDLAIRSRNFPGSQFQTDPSDNQRVIETSFGLFTNQVFIRARGRQLALKVSSDDLGVQWQLGSPRLDARPDGKQ